MRLADDARGVFTGSSLLFLEIEKQATRHSLGDYIGSLTPEGLEVVNRHRMSQAGARNEPLVCGVPVAALYGSSEIIRDSQQLIRRSQQNQSRRHLSAGRNRNSSKRCVSN